MFTKFGTNIDLMDLINPEKLCVNLFKGFDFTGGQNEDMYVKISDCSTGLRVSQIIMCNNYAINS